MYGGCSSVGRVQDCDSCCRGFESHQPPHKNQTLSLALIGWAFFFRLLVDILLAGYLNLVVRIPTCFSCRMLLVGLFRLHRNPTPTPTYWRWDSN